MKRRHRAAAEWACMREARARVIGRCGCALETGEGVREGRRGGTAEEEARWERGFPGARGVRPDRRRGGPSVVSMGMIGERGRARAGGKGLGNQPPAAAAAVATSSATQLAVMPAPDVPRSCNTLLRGAEASPVAQ